MTLIVIAVSALILFVLWCIDKCRELYLEKSKATELLSKIKSSEQDVTGDCKLYNETVTHFNNVIVSFPLKIFAAILRYKELPKIEKTNF